ncbi:MAG: hypothetical protein K2Q01_10300, partial [Rickettsiales bacterium]|nr:hypothetical protein [Rickettsiales bacterium]
LALGRFHRIIGMEDKDLQNPDMAFKSLDGEKRTFREAADRLDLPPYTPKQEDVLNNFINDPIGSDRITERGKKTFGQDDPKPHTQQMLEETLAKLPESFWQDITREAALPAGSIDTPDRRKMVLNIMQLLNSHYMHGDNFTNYVAKTENGTALNARENFMKAILDNMGFHYKDEGGKVTEAWESLKYFNAKAKENDGEKPTNKLKELTGTAIVAMTEVYSEEGKQSYAAKRMKAWLKTDDMSAATLKAKLPTLELSGMEGLQARILFQGSQVPGWSNNYTPWKDPHCDVAKLANDYHQKWTVPEKTTPRPHFTAAMDDQHKLRSQHHQARTQKWSEARNNAGLEARLPPH